MDTMSDAHVRELLAPLELDMQELEPMDAPGFWSVSGYISGAVVGSAASYVVVTVSISTITIT
ncbi:daptide-type RiPP [Cellulomonas chengniuliangii]|uniref:Uncharacterized protein n=1 Tax=Cellulomonas chengniuliangii TaxID=2968084 RepID=A0ABY5L392_9CELL|nr:daptide-type RiPP [Cellulomonas chengniuliangii]MCC2308119.1 hypothetical protein [Cellulomonas chengniuliangii]MCC2318342.1 hypothetical protein [Cellulomonas chengniuliangii]UUI76513.1 hypothetical protein NP064_06405 [Cellulomonas chengniuliangii]